MMQGVGQNFSFSRKSLLVREILIDDTNKPIHCYYYGKSGENPQGAYQINVK